MLASAAPMRAEPATPALQIKAVGPDLAYAFAILPADYHVTIKSPSPHGQIGKLSEIVKCDGVSMTGGFSRAAGPRRAPAGLIVVDGRQVSELVDRKDGGLVILDGGDALVLRLRERASWPRPLNTAIQSHPILIIDGKIDEPLDDPRRANRVALGRLRNGQLFMIMAYNRDRKALSAVTLRAFAHGASTVIGQPINWMMNFDGGPAAFVATPTQRIAPAAGEISSYLCAEERQ